MSPAVRSKKPSRLPTPFTVLQAGRSALTFFLADSIEILQALPSRSVSAMVTSPPYNLGIRYRTYDDSLPKRRYLSWTGEWIGAAARVLDPAGSLFLNVGGKPTDPWTALDVAQAARRHLWLQNTIHWIKSIAIDRDAAGEAARLGADVAIGHYKPINSERFVNDCHEFIFHFTPKGRTPLDRRAIGVAYQDASNIARWRTGGSNRRCRGNTWFIPYETIQSRDKDRPAPCDVPAARPGVLPPAARARASHDGHGSVPGARQQRRRGRPARHRVHWCRDGQALPRARRSRGQGPRLPDKRKKPGCTAHPGFSTTNLRTLEP